MSKERIDVLLVEKGYCETREKARRTIMAGLVLVNGQMVDKPGQKVDIESDVALKGKACPYVSRGGLKLEKALHELGIDIKGFVCADIGASTGGFTDCMLQHGAQKVYAIDVGYGQLDWNLRNREDVINMERTNIRTVDPVTFKEKLDLASIDVSFISLKLVLPVVVQLLKDEGHLICLIKPQFEAGREKVGKRGVVRDAKVHIDVLENVLDKLTNLGFKILYLSYSPVKGPKGNIEFLVYCTKSNVTDVFNGDKIEQVVQAAHKALIEET